MMRKAILLAALFAVSAPTLAAVKCGPFTIAIENHRDARIDGHKPTRQKITFTGEKEDYDNVKYHWIVKNDRAPGMLSMDHVYQAGRATLAVEVVRTSPGQIKISGSYDCQKIE